jgi:hypothetical protein
MSLPATPRAPTGGAASTTAAAIRRHALDANAHAYAQYPNPVTPLVASPSGSTNLAGVRTGNMHMQAQRDFPLPLMDVGATMQVRNAPSSGSPALRRGVSDASSPSSVTTSAVPPPSASPPLPAAGYSHPAFSRGTMGLASAETVRRQNGQVRLPVQAFDVPAAAEMGEARRVITKGDYYRNEINPWIAMHANVKGLRETNPHLRLHTAPIHPADHFVVEDHSQDPDPASRQAIIARYGTIEADEVDQARYREEYPESIRNSMAEREKKEGRAAILRAYGGKHAYTHDLEPMSAHYPDGLRQALEEGRARNSGAESMLSPAAHRQRVMQLLTQDKLAEATGRSNHTNGKAHGSGTSTKQLNSGDGTSGDASADKGMVDVSTDEGMKTPNPANISKHKHSKTRNGGPSSNQQHAIRKYRNILENDMDEIRTWYTDAKSRRENETRLLTMTRVWFEDARNLNISKGAQIFELCYVLFDQFGSDWERTPEQCRFHDHILELCAPLIYGTDFQKDRQRLLRRFKKRTFAVAVFFAGQRRWGKSVGLGQDAAVTLYVGRGIKTVAFAQTLGIACELVNKTRMFFLRLPDAVHRLVRSAGIEFLVSWFERAVINERDRKQLIMMRKFNKMQARSCIVNSQLRGRGAAPPSDPRGTQHASKRQMHTREMEHESK